MASVLLCGISLGGVSRLQVDVDEYKLLGEESRVVRAFRFAEERLQKPDTLEIEVVLPQSESLHDPNTTAKLLAFSDSLSKIDTLGPVRSVLDSMARARRLINGDDPAFEGLGGSASENAAGLAQTASGVSSRCHLDVCVNTRRSRGALTQAYPSIRQGSATP